MRKLLIRLYRRMFPRKLTDSERWALFAAMMDRANRRMAGETVEPTEDLIKRVLKEERC